MTENKVLCQWIYKKIDGLPHISIFKAHLPGDLVFKGRRIGLFKK